MSRPTRTQVDVDGESERECKIPTGVPFEQTGVVRESIYTLNRDDALVLDAFSYLWFHWFPAS